MDTERLILPSSELNALSYALELCCNQASSDYTDQKRNKMHPKVLKEYGDKLETCAQQTYVGARNFCSAEMDALSACMVKNKRDWVQCKDLRDSFQKCSVRNKLGELSP